MTEPAKATTPARLRELAAAAQTLGAEVDAAHAALAAEPEAAASTGFRLADTAGELRHAAASLEQTAGELARVRSVPGGACGAPWGVCPEHGNTLTATAGRTRCRTCGREWGYDRLSGPWPEPVTAQVTDRGGVSTRLCAGHTLAATAQLDGATITLLAPE